MKKVIKVAKPKLFGKFDYYILDFQHLTYRKMKADPSPEVPPTGSMETFFGRPLFLLRNQNSHFVWFPGLGEPVLISKLDFSTQSRFLFFKQLVIKLNGQTKSYFQLNWSGLSEQVDPFYDSFDKEMEDFMYDLEVSKRRQIGRDQQNQSPVEFEWD
jgi:hypothetical protein